MGRSIAAHEEGLVTESVAHVVLDGAAPKGTAEYAMYKWNSVDRDMLLAAMCSEPVQDVLVDTRRNLTDSIKRDVDEQSVSVSPVL